MPSIQSEAIICDKKQGREIYNHETNHSIEIEPGITEMMELASKNF